MGSIADSLLFTLRQRTSLAQQVKSQLTQAIKVHGGFETVREEGTAGVVWWGKI